MATTKAKHGFALKTFNDAGTGQTFEGGKVHEFEPGAWRNYAHCGLVRVPTEDELKGGKAETGTAPISKGPTA